MKKFIAIFLSITLASPSFAEMMCQEGAGENGFQSCSFEQLSDPSTCAQQTDPLVAHTGVDQYVQVCDDSDLGGINGKSKAELKDTKDEYKRLCKKKAKDYKRALMGNLLKKGKLGQLVQVLFKKKRFKTSSKDVMDKKVSLDSKQFEGKSEQEVENLILEELQKKYQEKKGQGDLKALAKEAAQSPAYKLGFHEIETVPVNVIANLDSKKACQVTVSELPENNPPKMVECAFCVEKNISSSFTNDCSYMVNSKYPESSSHKLMGVKKKTDFCNHEMAGEENDLSEVETMVDRICDIAKKGMKPEFTIETSRNQYKDKTPQLAAKRGEFIQNYIRNELMNGVKADGQKRCVLDESPEWLEEDQFNSAVKVTHPHYEWGNKKDLPRDYQGAKEGDYGPSPYATGDADQKREIENLKSTLAYEKGEIQKKLDLASSEKKKFIDENKGLLAKRDGKKGLSEEFRNEKKDILKMKQINPDVLAREKKIQDIVQMVGELDAKYNKNLQYANDLDQQIAGYQKRLKTIDAENQSKVSLLGQFYADKNQLGDAIDRKAWDDKLFNSFKMVRISGKAVEDHVLGIDPRYLTPAVKIALNALVEVENFTCVVEPIETKRTTFKGMLKGSLRVVTALASPVVALGGIAATTVAMPVTFLGSFFCEGCGDPGNIPPVLRFANPRALNLSKSSRREFGRDMKDAWSAYVNWGGLLEAKTGKDVKYFKNETEEVYEEQQERKSR